MNLNHKLFYKNPKILKANIESYTVVNTEPFIQNQTKISELDNILKTPTLNISSNFDLKGSL